jgi:hypothetical protein
MLDDRDLAMIQGMIGASYEKFAGIFKRAFRKMHASFDEIDRRFDGIDRRFDAMVDAPTIQETLEAAQRRIGCIEAAFFA